ncbi:hypothetical protein [uncultured Roseovarius sp.]|uniref:hypothetical protein n=1 Tax=uncultured Roseovarius sp. TaxID=293344 RepID=UPI00261AE91A|nr:hypothetical protein [uncultured Roseovarius sp.]
MISKTMKTMSNALCGAALMASSALAQDLPEPTIDKDTRGFSIGMSAEEVLNLIQADFPNARPHITKSHHPQSRQEFIYGINLIAGNEKVWFYFTGHYSGNRLYSLRREARFPQGERPLAADTRQQLLSKYGFPSSAGGHTLFYYYNEDEIILYGSDEELAPLLDTDVWQAYGFSDLANAKGYDITRQLEHSQCPKNIEWVQNGQAYFPLNPNPPMSEDCMAAMTIEASSADGLLAYLRVNIGDFRFVAESALIDQEMDIKPTETPSGEDAKL